MAKLKPGTKRPFFTKSPFFVDSNIWIAWFNKKDIDHEKAKKMIQSFPPDIPLLTSNLVIYEVLTVLSMRAGHKKALKFGKWFFPLVFYGAIGEVLIDEAIEHQTWALFRNIKRKDISFADCASVIVAKEYGANYILTFDQHFRLFEKDFDLLFEKDFDLKIWNHDGREKKQRPHKNLTI